MRLRWIGLAVSVALIAVLPPAAAGHPGRVTTDAEHIAEDTAQHDPAMESDLARRTRSATVADARAAAAAVVANEHEVGSWGPVANWPVVGIHAALLPNGKVLAYDTVGDARTESFPVHDFTRATVWDPETGTHTDVKLTGHNVFCSGLAHLSDGTLFLAGGNKNAALDGIAQTYTFNHMTNGWSRGADMAFERWYPTVTPLSNREMLITEGGPDYPEVYTTSGTLRTLTTAALNLPLYPWIHAAPDGRAFYAGPNQTMRALNTSGTGAWQTFGQRDTINRDYGSHTFYDIGRILVAGGGGSSADARTININGATPQVAATAPMANGRRQHNLTVLADGSVLATGGNSSGAGLVDLNNGVYVGELWTPTAGNPATGTWRTLAPETVTRQYHSTALLLPDGRVLSAGGGICGTCDQVGYLAKNAQVFTPPYLYKADGSGELAPRPTIASAPGAVAHGAGFQINTPDAAAIRKVALVRLGAVTHSVNMEQRYIPLTYTAGAGTLTATAPANANIAPPGVYMLFVTDAAGVPSVAKMVTVSATAPDTTPPTAPAGLTATPAGSSQVNLSWTAATDNVGVTGYRVERCQGATCTDFTQVATPTGTTYSDTGRSASTTYRYRVRAADAAGNLGGYSTVADATTSAAPSTPGLVGAWAFSEGSGTTTADASGNGNVGTLTNATWSTQGRFGNALSFNGTNSVVRVPSSASLNLTPGMTLSAWIRPAASLSGWRTIVQRQVDAYFLHASNNSPMRPAGGGTFGSAVDYLSGPTANPVNTWTHLAVTYNSTTLQLYVNGTQVATKPRTGAIQTTTTPLWIGGNQPYGEYFQGLIDEVRVYNRALTAADIQADMNTSIVPTGPDTTLPSTPTGLTATATSPTQINVSWTASTDNVGVTGYRVERCQGASCTNFTQVATPTATSYSDTGRAPSTTYRYQVRAIDAAGNLSPYSTIATATTPAAPDTTLPSTPTGLTATATSPTQINLSWTASTDNVGVTGYRVERCQGAGCTTFTQVGTPTATTFIDTDRAPSTSYRYQVRAIDAAGNLSGYSTAAEATTSAVQSATPTFVQTRAAESNSGTTSSVAFTNNNIAGNLIVAYVIWSNSGDASVSDSRGNTYAAAGPRTSWGTNWSSQVFYARNIAGGANAVTATFATAVNGGWGVVYLHEYSGVDRSNPLDVQTAAIGTSPGMNSGYVTTTSADALLFNAGASSSTVTAGGAGYTTRSTAFGNRTQDRNVSSVGTYNATMTQNSFAWVSHLVAFKAGSGSTDSTPPDVSISAPADNATVTGIENVIADASDNVGVDRVEFQIDGVDSGPADSTAPYALVWDTRTVGNGAHAVRARAYDAAGNSSLSPAVNVTVANTNTFQNEILLQGGLNLPTAMKFLPDGRLLVSELQGRIRVLSPPYTGVSSTPFLQITNIGVDGVQQGIYDFVLDPNFNVNHHYYVFYTLGTPNHDRVSRFTANALLNGTVAGSELVLYEDTQDAHAEHHGGALNFGNDGKLYFTTGEHFIPSLSQDLRNPRGKLHRINPDGTVPTDNPFFDGAGSNYDSVWARGLRNPFRAHYDPPTDRLIIADVGGNDYSTAIEEINVGARGANYGWPNVEGPCTAPCTGPAYSYAHNGRDASVTGGFVYHGDQFPSVYKGSYFFADYTQNWIKRLTFGADGNVNGVFNFEPLDGHVDGPYGDIVYLVEGPEGALYYLDLGYSDIGGSFGVSKLRRIRYIAGDQPPVASAEASPRSGPAPLTVDFSSAGSSDPEGQALSYSWTFGDGQNSTQANPSHTYQQPGTYSARLSVSDGTNTTLSTPMTITVGSTPTATILTPTDGATFRAGDVISFSGDGTDTDDGSLPAGAFTWNIDFLHDGHVHPALAQQGKTGSFTIPTVGHDSSGNTRYRISLTVTDSHGLTDTKSVVVWPQKVNLSFNTVPADGTIYLDGIAKTAPFVHDTLVGFQHTIEARDQTIGGSNYTFDSWSDGGARLHTITVPATDHSYTVTLKAAPQTAPPAFVQTRAAESNSGTTSSVAFTNSNTAGNLIVAYVIWNNAGGVSVSDSRGNTYASAGARTTWGSNWSSQIFYARNIAGGANTVTATFATAVNGGWGVIYVHEYSGMDRSNPLDAQTAATGTSPGMNSGTVNTTSANDLLFNAGASSSTVTAGGAGYTTRSTAFDNRTQDRNVSSAGAYSATMTQNSFAWVSHLVAFRGAAGG